MGLKASQHVKLSLMKKFIMGGTGMFLCLFIAGHVAGNALIVVSAEAFNDYAYKLTSNKPFLYTVETLLGLVFLIHVCMALKLTLENRAARPIGYKKSFGKSSLSEFASATMPYTGLLIAAFIVWHLVGIKFGANSTEGEVMRDLHNDVLIYFGVTINAVGYVLAMLAVGLHVLHGFWSTFQSLGVNREKFDGTLRKGALLFSLTVVMAFITFVIWCNLQGVK